MKIGCYCESPADGAAMTDRPSLERETECAVTEARRIISDLAVLETAFPAGFGLMAQEVRSWLAAT
jgi:hypothetical protein